MTQSFAFHFDDPSSFQTLPFFSCRQLFSISGFRLHSYTLLVKTRCWEHHDGTCDKCGLQAIQDEKHALFLCPCMQMCSLRLQFVDLFHDLPLAHKVTVNQTGAFYFSQVPNELRICTKCNWHCVQDEKHALLDRSSADLANLCVKHRQLFRSPSRNSNRLRDFISQADTKGLALYVHECLECCA